MENLATRKGIPPSPTPPPSLVPSPSPFLHKSLSKFLHTLRKDMYKFKVHLGCGRYSLHYSNTPPSPDTPVPAATNMTSTMAPEVDVLVDHIEGSLEHLESRPRVIRSKVDSEGYAT